uniref:Acetylornithine transaminase n=1 Tax=Alexandrium catenella TaxID=2925 RepID=A0A7S1S0V8_ALECA
MIGSGIGRLSNMVLERGEGSWVFTKTGEKYLDFSTGIGVTSLGHCHPRVKEAVIKQLDKLWHAQVNIAYHDQMLELVGKFKKAMPTGSLLDTFLFVTSGSEAVEAAVKLARHYTRKPNIICFQGSYHGRTLLTMSMTSSKTIYKAGYGPHAAGISFCPHPFYSRKCHIPDELDFMMTEMELLLKQQTTPEETAALIIEPVLGEGGYVPHPPGLLPALREFCDRHGILFIADEVQSGAGRTGKMWAMEHEGVHPDILVFAKGIATGFPLAGIASRKELMDVQPGGSQGGTYAGNIVACAAANAVLDVMAEPGFFETVQARGQQIKDGLEAMKRDGVAPITEVRGPGLMIGVEFDENKVGKGFSSQVCKACLSNGLILLNTGLYETMRVIPPLTVSEEECDIALSIFRKSLQQSLV